MTNGNRNEEIGFVIFGNLSPTLTYIVTALVTACNQFMFHT